MLCRTYCYETLFQAYICPRALLLQHSFEFSFQLPHDSVHHLLICFSILDEADIETFDSSQETSDERQSMYYFSVLLLWRQVRNTVFVVKPKSIPWRILRNSRVGAFKKIHGFMFFLKLAASFSLDCIEGTGYLLVVKYYLGHVISANLQGSTLSN